MAKSVNKVILVGNIVRDPEVKFTPSGVAIANTALATNESFKDKSGEWQERPEFHNLKAFQKTAEILGEYAKKGTKVYIEGRLQTESWDDKKSGEKKYKTVINIDQLVLLSPKKETTTSPDSSVSPENAPAEQGVLTDAF